MQTIVLIGILTDLMVKRKLSRETLSEKFELSGRTITRYIDVLTKAGVPIESRAGIGGGYILPDDYKIDRTLFSAEEYQRIADALTKTAAQYPDKLNEKILKKLGHR